MDDKTCPVCKLQFSRKDVMMRHHRNKHGITEPYPQTSHADPPPPQQRKGTSPPPPPPPQREGTSSPPRGENTPPRDKETAPPRKEETEHFVFKHPFTMKSKRTNIMWQNIFCETTSSKFKIHSAHYSENNMAIQTLATTLR
ncbi:Hypothetical predicted protein [Mytilus galloprovincialis]|uniref:C2H2-type domain-containing protein n=1 Tax=Mytilus galloprovincialis TaxID=29158 RepID=A0A8B6HHA9_MYTGA|nr:Hypothetical predicted protein [Mytilus galloprovincialis]